MPLLVYSYPPFVANTVIQSAKVNAKFSDISTLLNTTGLDDTNLQNAGITRSTKLKAGTANYAVYNDALGKLTEAAALPILSGGTGLSLTLSGGDAGKTFQVNGAGTSIVLTSPSAGPASLLYNLYRFT